MYVGKQRRIKIDGITYKTRSCVFIRMIENARNGAKQWNILEKESDFESALIAAPRVMAGRRKVIQHPTEKDLIQNWADILFENNRDIDRLNNCPLIPEEMDELLEQIRQLRTPLALNGFINGKTVSITRKKSR